jgi:hypothetical protein
MEYKEILTLIKRAINRIQTNINRYNEYDSRLALIDLGKELRQIEAIIDEAYLLNKISKNSFYLLRKWFLRFEHNLLSSII